MDEFMRALVVSLSTSSGALEVRDVAVAPVGAGQLRVEVHAVGVNFRDVHSANESASETAPMIPGTDYAGVVVEVAPDVSDFEVGDRVFGAVLDSAYAEYVVTNPAMVFRLPNNMSFAHGAALPVSGLSASFLASVAGLRAGDTVVTLAAAGGLGCYLGAVFASLGVTSIGLTSSETKARVAIEAGHQHVINYTTTDPVKEVHQLTGGTGADVVIDSVAGARFAESFRMLKNSGTVILCGTSGGEPAPEAFAGEFLASRRNLALREFYLVTHIFDHFDELPSRIGQLLGLFEAGTLHVPITSFDFEDVASAHALLETGRSSGKLVLEISRN